MENDLIIFYILSAIITLIVIKCAAKDKQSYSKDSIIWIVENNKKIQVARYTNGSIYAISRLNTSNNWMIGGYDVNGSVYGVQNNLIGFVSEYSNIVLSREYKYEELNVTTTDRRLIKPRILQKKIGEVCGDKKGGAIFEGSNYEEAVAYYESGQTDQDTNCIGAGAAYIALIKEGVISSQYNDFYYNLY